MLLYQKVTGKIQKKLSGTRICNKNLKETQNFQVPKSPKFNNNKYSLEFGMCHCLQNKPLTTKHGFKFKWPQSKQSNQSAVYLQRLGEEDQVEDLEPPPEPKELPRSSLRHLSLG